MKQGSDFHFSAPIASQTVHRQSPNCSQAIPTSFLNYSQEIPSQCPNYPQKTCKLHPANLQTIPKSSRTTPRISKLCLENPPDPPQIFLHNLQTTRRQFPHTSDSSHKFPTIPTHFRQFKNTSRIPKHFRHFPQNADIPHRFPTFPKHFEHSLVATECAWANPRPQTDR